MSISRSYDTGERNEDGTLKHIDCEGARFHVLRWSLIRLPNGREMGSRRCSERECEVNRDDERDRERLAKEPFSPWRSHEEMHRQAEEIWELQGGKTIRELVRGANRPRKRGRRLRFA